MFYVIAGAAFVLIFSVAILCDYVDHRIKKMTKEE
jgi:hypothetical protein